MSMSRTVLVAFALVLSSYSQTKPNFSGTWKLNLSKSDFGMMPTRPDSRTDVIEQSEDVIKDTVSQQSEQGAQNYVVAIKTDGTESPVKLAAGDAKVSGSWSGDAFAVTTKLNFQGNEILVNSKWTLSGDGNTYTQVAHITSPMGETDTKLVFDKQGTAGATAVGTAASSTAPASAPMPSAGGRPNFSGVWKLNVAKSDFGPLPGPDSETDTIEHNDPMLKMAVDQKGAQGARQYQLDININGKEEAHKLGPQDVKTTSQWDGSALVVLTKLTFQDNEVLIKSSYTLSPDGKTVTNSTHLSSPMGEADQKLVYDKQ